MLGDVEYLRIGDDRYFRGDAIFGHAAAPQWTRLSPRDRPPLDGFYELSLHLTNPRTIGYSFDSIQTSLYEQYRRVQMRPTGLKAYTGHPCQEWAYDWYAKDLPMHDTLCIRTTDHLPYHLTVSGGWAEATYEWNPEVSIEAPTGAF
ncbi:MAG TPA: hypothetical protein VFA04_02110 [Bryobacteraceae bacterium]|nr:hypothetical protein [Bryobacteraceae bacterium]